MAREGCSGEALGAAPQMAGASQVCAHVPCTPTHLRSVRQLSVSTGVTARGTMQELMQKWHCAQHWAHHLTHSLTHHPRRNNSHSESKGYGRTGCTFFKAYFMLGKEAANYETDGQVWEVLGPRFSSSFLQLLTLNGSEYCLSVRGGAGARS